MPIIVAAQVRGTAVCPDQALPEDAQGEGAVLGQEAEEGFSATDEFIEGKNARINPANRTNGQT